MSFHKDQELAELLTNSNATISRLAQDLLTTRQGIRRVMDSEFIMWEEREALEELLATNTETVSPVPKTTEEKVEFRKAWDKRVEEGK